MNPGLQSRVVDQSTWSSGGLRKTSPRGADGGAGIQAQAGQPVEQATDRGVRLEPREVHADADVRAVREGDCCRASCGARRSGRGRRTRPDRGWPPAIETLTRSPRADRRAAELDVLRSRSGRPPPRPARAGVTPRPRWAGGPGRARTSASCSGCGEQVQRGVGDHALGRLDPAEQQHRGVGHDRARARARGRRGGRQQRGAGLPVQHRLDGGRERREGRACRPRAPRRRP